MTDFSDSVRLRGHHLLCLLTYKGLGYNPSFVQNFNTVAARVRAGTPIRIVRGPDDVCAPMISTGGADVHCPSGNVKQRDVIALRQVGEVLSQPLAPNTRIRMGISDYGRLRDAFKAGTIRGACVSCPWDQTCTHIAADGFAKTKLLYGG